MEKNLIEKLSITGPCLLYNSINFKKRPNLGYSKLDKKKIIYLYKFSKNIYDKNGRLIIKNKIPYISGPNYKQLFNMKMIYSK